MAREPFPSETQDRFLVRFPEGMRERIRKAAEENNRSMNAEIVARLQYTFGMNNPDFKTQDVEVEFMKLIDNLVYMMKNSKADGSVVQLQIIANKPMGDEDEKRGVIVDPNLSVQDRSSGIEGESKAASPPNPKRPSRAR